ncbi:MAG: 4-hydroxy-tetrahydrodipicolinate reductase [Spirochaetes bacterium GWF1_31_7]|nr:MAG: 4-hydroxy-tetrahydrodipicolinate reductase [Spirochaetes bacterium GWE1_32_154]OHD51594.1 MAG: 4-hydroxy-tetrahydrodipicolinate reductase [Spirochaetes bacterium GWE2_31_10]OHD52972.1 MAG: 4-hydroxy-tetrahydrodipicolinate reductase [Spirochaetes bacterium GWF1_31_7]HBD93717.1 4-hydroxy-tetrahydrodipicolinate reductase [Spirochaetia bacterium]HBI37221.1 4-hydroxy-tetrahydrodipicolinate reductase [Spirochaetia bacterium]
MNTIAIVGYGRMGKQIELVLAEKNIKPVSIIDGYAKDATYKEINADSLKGVSVVIDFSSPETVMENIKKYIECGVSVVMGTTGWYDKIDEVKKLVGNSIGFIWSGNYSLGVNLYFKIIEYASKLIGKFEAYDPMVHEFHHKEKKDSPSGTALMIADLVKSGYKESRDSIVTERLNRKKEANEIHVSSTRGGYIPGTHIVAYDSVLDTIELKHTARTREGFALGAVTAALWLDGKKGFYKFDETLDT